jgi:hypothetical protein
MICSLAWARDVRAILPKNGEVERSQSGVMYVIPAMLRQPKPLG